MPCPTTFKRCACRDPHTGRRLGNSCPKLHRAGTRNWSATHGSWHYRLELPPTADGKRRQLRHGGFATATAAIDEHDHIRSLLHQAHRDLSDARQIADIIQLTIHAGTPVPDIDATRRRLHTGCPSVRVPTVAEYLTTWLAGLHLDANTIRGYDSHIRVHLIPHLGHLPLNDLDASHINTMLTAITRPNPDQAGNPGPQHSNRTTGPATRHHILATLHKALADAVIQHLRMNNPADHIHLPTAPRPKARLWTDERVRHWQATAGKPGPVMVWTPQQTGAFLDHAQAADPDLTRCGT